MKNLLELGCQEIVEQYGRYRLHLPEAERAMARSLERYGQLSPVVVCRRQDHYELTDGFKRLGAARTLARMSHLSARLLDADERAAKAAIYGLNRAGGRTRELEEAWIMARHPLYPSGVIGEKHSLPEHSPGRDHHQKYELLKQRFAEFGPDGTLFFDELVRTRRCGKNEAARAGPVGHIPSRGSGTGAGTRHAVPRVLLVRGGTHSGQHKRAHDQYGIRSRPKRWNTR